MPILWVTRVLLNMLKWFVPLDESIKLAEQLLCILFFFQLNTQLSLFTIGHSDVCLICLPLAKQKPRFRFIKESSIIAHLLKKSWGVEFQQDLCWKSQTNIRNNQKCVHASKLYGKVPAKSPALSTEDWKCVIKKRSVYCHLWYCH